MSKILLKKLYSTFVKKTNAYALKKIISFYVTVLEIDILLNQYIFMV